MTAASNNCGRQEVHLGTLSEIPGGGSVAVFVKAGHVVRLVNTPGTQTVDTWCIAARDMTEYLSVEHTRRMLSRLFPRAGDSTTNTTQAITPTSSGEIVKTCG